MPTLISFSELCAQLQQPMVAQAAAVVAPGIANSMASQRDVDPYFLVDLESQQPADLAGLRAPACPVVGVTTHASPAAMSDLPDCVDVVVETAAQRAAVIGTIRAQPVAASLLVQVLRHNACSTIGDGLLAESLTYSTLQHSAGFRQWLGARELPLETPVPVTEAPLVLVTRDGNRLLIRLNRPEKRNAYSQVMRDLLCEALELACTDTRIERVELSGAGPSFCAGGDLSEFGHARDAGIAHQARIVRSAARLLVTLGERLGDGLQARLQGACIGAGIELSGFVPHVVAEADAVFQLPEVGFGLIPGAGGTVSLVRRIGRRRTAFMALSQHKIAAPQALAWGLVDELTGGG